MSAVHALARALDLVYFKSEMTPALNKQKMPELTAVNWACSIKNIKNDLNFNPRYSLEEGLHETIIWYKNNNWL